jgi:hypothetical protein
MSVLRVLSSAGDREFTWEPAQVATGDPEAIAAVREAERIFSEQRRRGGTGVRVQTGQPGVRLDTFDPQAEVIIMMPRVVGG